MHWIQKHILQQLAVHPTRRYSQLKPDGVEGNLFMYHTKQLQAAGYICTADHAYMLAERGKTYVSSMSLTQGKPRIQPKIVVLLVCQNASGQYLLFRWRRQPYYGLVSFPFSKIHFGRPLGEILEEELHNKANLRGRFSYVGDVYIRTLNNHNDTVDHLLAHIYKVTHISGELWADSLTGQPFWGAPAAVPKEEQAPGFIEVLRLVQTKESGFLKEITVVRETT